MAKQMKYASTSIIERIKKFDVAEARAKRDIPKSKIVRASQSIGRFQKTRLGVRSREFRKGILPATKEVYKLRGLATVLGAAGSPSEYKRLTSQGRPGRPQGSYKRGIPAEQYRTIQRQRERLMRELEANKYTQYAKQGYTPEQAAQVMAAKRQLTQQPKAPQQMEVMARGRVVTPEDRFRELVNNQELSPNTVMMLDRLRQVQQKAQIDDFENQRRLKERRIVAQAGNLLKARNLFGPDSAKFNILETEGNILQAPNAFLEDANNNILRNNGRPSILNTKEAGNNLFY